MTLTTNSLYWTESTGSLGVAKLARFLGNDNWAPQVDGPAVNEQMNWVGSEAVAPTPPPPPGSTPIYDFDDYRDTRGREPVDPAIFQQPGTYIIGYDGQSMKGNYSQHQDYAPQEVYELNVYDGNIYRCDSNCLAMGSDGAPLHPSYPDRTSLLNYENDQLRLSGKCARVLRACIMAGGTSDVAWTQGSSLSSRRRVVLEKLAALGLAPNLWISVQGQGSIEPGPHQIVSAQNYANFRWWGMDADLRQAGYSGPIMIGRGAFWKDYSDILYPTQYQWVRQGQVLLAQQHGLLLGPDDDLYTSVGPAGSGAMRIDSAHWGGPGIYWQTIAWVNAIPSL